MRFRGAVWLAFVPRHDHATDTRPPCGEAIAERHPQPGLIHHSDRGVQYASHDYVEQLEQIGAQISMSSVSNPYDNAKAESFFKTLKQEEVYLKEYESFADAEANLAGLH